MDHVLALALATIVCVILALIHWFCFVFLFCLFLYGFLIAYFPLGTEFGFLRCIALRSFSLPIHATQLTTTPPMNGIDWHYLIRIDSFAFAPTTVRRRRTGRQDGRHSQGLRPELSQATGQLRGLQGTNQEQTGGLVRDLVLRTAPLRRQVRRAQDICRHEGITTLFVVHGNWMDGIKDGMSKRRKGGREE